MSRCSGMMMWEASRANASFKALTLLTCTEGSAAAVNRVTKATVTRLASCHAMPTGQCLHGKHTACQRAWIRRIEWASLVYNTRLVCATELQIRQMHCDHVRQNLHSICTASVTIICMNCRCGQLSRMYTLSTVDSQQGAVSTFHCAVLKHATAVLSQRRNIRGTLFL
jgi:hypothetical protein